MRNSKDLEGVNALGKKVAVKYEYDASLLESFCNKHPDNDYLVTLDAFEFTSLCPITGQPDYAKITINYIPNINMVESKSLKLYLASFRNSGEFHEDCINIIMKDLIKLMSPKYIEVFGNFNSRGGIAICPFVNFAGKNSGYEDLAKTRLFENMAAQIAKNNGQ